MWIHLIITVASLTTAAVAIPGWRKARRQVNQFRGLYWAVQRALKEETGRKDV